MRHSGLKLLVVQQVPHEGPGLIGVEAARAGMEMDIVKVYGHGPEARVPRSTDGYSALVVLGGPMGVYEADIYPFITDELRLVESALKHNVPILGVCLGSQLLAHAAGARVTSGAKKEIGWHKVRLTDEGRTDRLASALPPEFYAFHWHGDTFTIPEGCANLAGSDLFENQLIRVGQRAYGVQFHLEVTGAMATEWLDVNADEVDSVSDYVDPVAIAAETPERMPELTRFGGAFVRRFLRMVAS